jgi:hypothetical protein
MEFEMGKLIAAMKMSVDGRDLASVPNARSFWL